MKDAQLSRTHRTTLLGGCGIILGTLYAFILSLPDLVPIPRDYVFSSSPALQLAGSAVVAVSFAILAFGVPDEPGIVGDSHLGRICLFAFGAHQLVSDLGALLSTDFAQPGATIGGYASLVVFVIGLAGAVVASIIVVRVGVLRGYARWALVPVAAIMSLEITFMIIPLQEISFLSYQINALELVALIVAGTAYALAGRGPAIRKRLQLINEKW